MLTGGMYKRMWVQTNAAGLREPDFERLKTSTLRILTIGDSFTFGTGIEAEQAWPAQLERALAQEGRGASIAVVNGGIPGYGLAQMRDLTEELLPNIDPQLVILAVYAGGFDRMRDPFTALGSFVVRSSSIGQIRIVDGGVIISHQTPSLAPFDLWLKSHWYSGAYLYDAVYRLLRNGRDFVNSWRGRDTLAVAAGGLREGLAEIVKIKNITADKGIPLLVLLVGSFDMRNRPDAAQQATIDAVREFCSREKIPAIDPTATLLGSGEPLRVSEEDFHWSAHANALVAKRLAAPALSLLARRGSLTLLPH
jgi:lysophospholipase L1-like esterase